MISLKNFYIGYYLYVKPSARQTIRKYKNRFYKFPSMKTNRTDK